MVRIWRQPATRPSLPVYLQTSDGERWYPLIFDRSRDDDAEAMDELRTEVSFIHDTIDAQLRDLIKIRAPSRMLSDDDLERGVQEFLGAVDIQTYGRWVYYPWSRRLVHVLPQPEFFEVRSDRNRNKITAAEQTKLSRLKIGLAGLSVGNAVAVTLALEGLFGELRLADFDTLDLSNMNRLRCTVDQIGLNKAVICARQIFEMNPYANVVIYPDGITRENIGAFFDDGGRLDIAIDECDGMFAKFKIREEARARRIPVLMETSDRGMLDVERFDLEPKRPLLHGLVGAMTADEVERLPPPARIGVLLNIVGMHSMSSRLAASLLEHGRTLRGFSQLGSDVTLGGATTSTAVRRLGLGMPLASGRAYIDLSVLLGNIEAPPLPPDIAESNRVARERARVEELVRYAVMAPSSGNMQPWLFRHRSQGLHVYRDPARSGGDEDEFGRFDALISIGAAIENITIAAAAQGCETRVELFPAPFDPELVAVIHLGGEVEGSEDPLFEQIPRRVTNRGTSSRQMLNQTHVQVLMEAARQQGVRLQLCQDRAAMGELAQLLGEADRIQILAPKLHDEYFERLRWSAEEVARTRDGLDVAGLQLGPGMDLLLQVASQAAVAKNLRSVRGGGVFAAPAIHALASSAAVGLLTIEGTTPQAFVQGGRALQNLWLTANALGLAVHPWNGLINLFTRVERYHGAKLERDDVRALSEMREQFMRYFTVSLGDTEIMMFRLSYADAPKTRSLRRPVEMVLSFEL